MPAQLKIARGRSIQSAGVSYDIQIDGDVVGRLGRGQAQTFDIEPGTHDVQAFFAKTGWQVPDVKCSPVTPIVVTNGERVTLNVKLGPAYRSGTPFRGTTWAAEDHLLLDDVSADQAFKGGLTMRAWMQGGLALLALVAFALTAFVFKGGSPPWFISFLTVFATAAIFAYHQFSKRISRRNSRSRNSK